MGHSPLYRIRVNTDGVGTREKSETLCLHQMCAIEICFPVQIYLIFLKNKIIKRIYNENVSKRVWAWV